MHSTSDYQHGGGRRPVPSGIAAQVLFAHDRMCCVCRSEESATQSQIHHLDGRNDRHEIDNLAVLCLTHHAQTQTRGGFQRHLDEGTVRLYRDDWVQKVAARRAQAQDVDAALPLIDTSEFVRDVTIPDGTTFKVNEAFTKVWEIRNVGSVSWEGRRLVRMGTESPVLPRSKAWVPILDTQPGQTVQIAVDMRAPEVAGTAFVIWKMAFADGGLCFPDRYPYGLAVLIDTRT